MIKYAKISLGSKVYNTEARELRDFTIKPKLRRMHCTKCNIDTIITFIEWDRYIIPTIDACCSKFEAHIKSKLPEHFN